MNNTVKGVCLSGLLYPGAGQIVQKHYFRGIALIAIATASLSAAIISAARQAQAILTAVESNGSGYDVTTILHEATRLSAGPDSQTMEMSSVLIVGCWVVGIVDAYLSGKKMDIDKTAHDKAL